MLDLPSFPYRSRSEVHADFWNSTPTGTLIAETASIAVA